MRAQKVATLVALAVVLADPTYAAATPHDAYLRSMPEIVVGSPAARTQIKLQGVNSDSTALSVSPDRLTRSMTASLASSEENLRGPAEEALFARYGRSVVLILTPDGLGSGSIISKDGLILTNNHVVGARPKVAVLFKPAIEGAMPVSSDAVIGTVVRVDQVADLALVKIAMVPTGTPILSLAEASKIVVGADVHAIGHPIGEVWTYTRGFISQFRLGYKWTAEDKFAHRADVVQTQTPISPGNSGGPLLDGDGELIGVNAFISPEGNSLNFAIASSEVKRFLSEKKNRIAALAPSQAAQPQQAAAPCKPSVLKKGKSKQGDDVAIIDFDCDGRATAALVTPKDPTQPIVLIVSRRPGAKPEAIYYDLHRANKWDYVAYDVDGSGEAQLFGFDIGADGKPQRFELAKH